jgi:hypothetical protein
VVGSPNPNNERTSASESVSRAVPLPFHRWRRRRSGTASTCVPVVCDLRNEAAQRSECVASLAQHLHALADAARRLGGKVSGALSGEANSVIRRPLTRSERTLSVPRELLADAEAG